MSENINKTSAAENSEVAKDYVESYSPKVHVIGRSTMLIAFVLSILPILYLYFVKGYRMPISSYIAVAATITAMFVGNWLTEALTWFPVLGAAPIYMSYLSGNVKNVRVPIARSLQNTYDVPVESPKGQIITTIGVAISVYVNLAILLIVVLLGDKFISLLPDAVVSAFNYVLPALIGALLSFRVTKSGLVKTLIWCIPSLIVYIFIRSNVLPFLAMYGQTTAIAVTVLVGYISFRIEGKKEAEK